MSTEIEKEMCPRFLRLLEPKLETPAVNKLITQIKTESSAIFSEWFKIVKQVKKQQQQQVKKEEKPIKKSPEIKTDSSFLSTVNEASNLKAEEAEARKKARKEEKRRKKEIEKLKQEKQEKEAQLKRKNSVTDDSDSGVPDPKSPKIENKLSEAERNLDKKLIELGIGKDFGGDHHKKPKKRITWRDIVERKCEDRQYLVDEFVFELDPDERVNVNKLKLQGVLHEGDALRQSVSKKR